VRLLDRKRQAARCAAPSVWLPGPGIDPNTPLLHGEKRAVQRAAYRFDPLSLDLTQRGASADMKLRIKEESPSRGAAGRSHHRGAG